MGRLGLYRSAGRPLFDADEQRFLAAVAPSLGRRRAHAPCWSARHATPRARTRPGWSSSRTTGGRVRDARRRALAGRPARRRLGRGQAAVVGASRSPAARCGTAEQPEAPARSRRAGALALRHVGRAPRRLARGERLPSRRGDRRARPSGAHRAAADGRLRADRPRAGGHPTRPAGRLDGPDRRPPGGLAAHRAGAPQERSSRRRPSAADAISSARCSSRTTSHACATTSAGRWTRSPCAAGPSGLTALRGFGTALRPPRRRARPTRLAGRREVGHWRGDANVARRLRRALRGPRDEIPSGGDTHVLTVRDDPISACLERGNRVIPKGQRARVPTRTPAGGPARTSRRRSPRRVKG